MGRNIKAGLDYFSHDCDISDDEKVQLLQSECGILGYAVFMKLLERIYRNGYFLAIDDKFIRIFSMRNGIDKDECKSIIDVCINENLFDKKTYKKHQVLTSAGIQKRYLAAIERRKEVSVYVDYLLINVSENGKYDNINLLNVGSGTQSKVKESKVKYIECVFLAPSAHKKLLEKHGEKKLKLILETLNNYKMAKGKKYKSDYHAILNWVEDSVSRIQNGKSTGTCPNCKRPNIDLTEKGFCNDCN